MSTIYEVRSIALNDSEQHDWGARHTRSEAEAPLAERTTGKNQAWAEKHHGRWWIEGIDTTGLFEIPSAPTPRERFSARTTTVETGEGTWNKLHVEVLDESGRVIAAYDRNYLKLASHPKLEAKEFIECSFEGGRCTVTFSVLASFGLDTGARTDAEPLS